MAVRHHVERATQVQDDRLALAALHLAKTRQTLFSRGQSGLHSLTSQTRPPAPVQLPMH